MACQFSTSLSNKLAYIEALKYDKFLLQVCVLLVLLQNLINFNLNTYVSLDLVQLLLTMKLDIFY